MTTKSSWGGGRFRAAARRPRLAPLSRVTCFTRAYSPLVSLFYDNVIAPGTLAVTRDPLQRQLADLPREAVVLDVGCGGGQAARFVLQARGDLRVVALDPSRSLIHRAARRASHGCGTVQAVAAAIPLSDAAVDLTVSLFAIKHWPDQVAGAAECARVTRPGGRLLIAEIDATADIARWRAFVDRTRMPASMRGAYVRLTAGPILKRALRADQLHGILDRVPTLRDVRVEQDPEHAVVTAQATVS